MFSNAANHYGVKSTRPSLKVKRRAESTDRLVSAREEVISNGPDTSAPSEEEFCIDDHFQQTLTTLVQKFAEAENELYALQEWIKRLKDSKSEGKVPTGLVVHHVNTKRRNSQLLHESFDAILRDAELKLLDTTIEHGILGPQSLKWNKGVCAVRIHWTNGQVSRYERAGQPQPIVDTTNQHCCSSDRSSRYSTSKNWINGQIKTSMAVAVNSKSHNFVSFLSIWTNFHVLRGIHWISLLISILVLFYRSYLNLWRGCRFFRFFCTAELERVICTRTDNFGICCKQIPLCWQGWCLGWNFSKGNRGSDCYHFTLWPCKCYLISPQTGTQRLCTMGLRTQSIMPRNWFKTLTTMLHGVNLVIKMRKKVLTHNNSCCSCCCSCMKKNKFATRNHQRPRMLTVFVTDLFYRAFPMLSSFVLLLYHLWRSVSGKLTFLALPSRCLSLVHGHLSMP